MPPSVNHGRRYNARVANAMIYIIAGVVVGDADLESAKRNVAAFERDMDGSMAGVIAIFDLGPSEHSRLNELK